MKEDTYNGIDSVLTMHWQQRRHERRELAEQLKQGIGSCFKAIKKPIVYTLLIAGIVSAPECVHSCIYRRVLSGLENEDKTMFSLYNSGKRQEAEKKAQELIANVENKRQTGKYSPYTLDRVQSDAEMIISKVHQLPKN